MKKEYNNQFPRVATFQQYIIVLTEAKEFEKAIQICKSAINHGLDVGTQSGFKGRIERIKKKIKPKA